MRTPLVDRRDFLKAAGIGFVAAMTPSAWAKTLAADAVFATAFVKRDGSFGAAVLSEAGKVAIRLTRGKSVKRRTAQVAKGTSTLTISGLRAGSYSVQVTATDLAGNAAGAPKRARVTVR